MNTPSTDQDEPKQKRARLELLRLEQDIKRTEIQNIYGVVQLMTIVHPDWKTEDQDFRKQASAAIKSVLPPTKALSTPLSITQVSRALGHKLTCSELVRAEHLAQKRYAVMHGRTVAANRLETVDGEDLFVNVYTEADREMLEKVLIDLGIAPGSDSDSDSSDA